MKLGCSSLSCKTKDNKHLLGRTYDQFGDLKANKIVVIPKNQEIYLDNSNSNNKFLTKHSFVGMAVLGAKTPILVDGVNDKGLMGALLHYPNFAKYDTNKRNDVININPGFFITYVLGECSSIEEIVKKLKYINLKEELLFGKEIPVHYIFTDKSGETIIVEPDSSGVSIHRNTIGVLTNSPNYAWHKQNLSRYSQCKNNGNKSFSICDEEFLNHEIRGLRIPGDYSSASRFVRVALTKNYSPLAENEIDAVTKVFHAFAPVDIPAGIKTITIDEGQYKGNYYEKTLCMSIVCSESLTYYYTLATNRRIQAIKLDNEILNKDIKYFSLQEEQDILYKN
ncbi:MAG: linear amide C-N hydrolase [Clostridium sp.]|uniref:linear amide C-N hydrolase n=1 Tax=Clostridium sp. TaxID=1506 RepID=UPI003F2DFC15